MKNKIIAVYILLILLALTGKSLTSCSKASPLTNLYIEPATTTVRVGEYISLNISIADVSQLAAWQISLYYENSILNGTLTTEGPFLRQAGPTFFYQVQFNDNYNTTHGLLELICSVTGETSGANGTGTLASVIFLAIGNGNATLHFDDTKLGDAAIPPNPIPHTTTDGNIQVTGIKDIAITKVSPLKTVVGQGCTMDINVTVENQGDYTETFNVTLYVNTTIIETREITLESAVSTTLTFTWNTSGFTKGNYTIWAYASPVQGETDTADNTGAGAEQVHVGVPGNVWGNQNPPPVYDDVCNMRDVTYLILRFNTNPRSPNWDPNTDVNNDGVCNMRDVTVAILNFNKRE